MRQALYALLVVAGFAATVYFNIAFARAHHAFSVIDFVRGGFANPAAASITCDITVAFLAFLVWLPDEARRSGVRFWWLYALIGLTVAFAVALPLFLFMRERALRRNSGRA
jgi:hypothetical protein